MQLPDVCVVVMIKATIISVFNQLHSLLDSLKFPTSPVQHHLNLNHLLHTYYISLKN